MSNNICDNDKQFLIDIAKKIKSKNLNVPSIFFRNDETIKFY